MLRADERAGGQDPAASFLLVAVRDAQARLAGGAAVLPGQHGAGGAHLVVRCQVCGRFTCCRSFGVFRLLRLPGCSFWS